MVKNVKGGKHKNQARKNLIVPDKQKLRLKMDDDEMYAVVTKKLGDNKVEVLCLDTKIRLCVISGKFKSRGRRDNTIDINSWILVGIRSWETLVEGKKEKCDLLEVYNENEKIRLQTTVSECWGALGPSDVKEESNIYFMNSHDQEQEDVRNEIKNSTVHINMKNIKVISENSDDEIINFDDI